MDFTMDIKTKTGEIMMDLLIEDYEAGLGSLVRFEKVIEEVKTRFSIEITNDNIRETLEFIKENALESPDLIYATWGTAGFSASNIPYVKGELGPNDLKALRNLFSQFNKIVSTPPAKFFVKNLSKQQMTFLTVALMKGLFPRPRKGQLLLGNVSSDGDGEIISVFENQYFDNLFRSIEKAYQAGSFAKSNSEMEWIDLRNALRSATGTDKIDLTRLTDHISAE